jgi:CRISPR/Cas system-associated exonuclease Cas4 (RecB family)
MAYSLSPTALSLFKDCPMCFWLEHNRKIKRPDGIFPSLPGGMDRILKTHFDSYIGKDRLPPELEKKVDAKLFDNRVLLEKWRDYRQGLVLQDEKGNILRGAIDTLLVSNGKIIVLDYKTRGYECKDDSHKYYTDQMDIYNYLLRMNGYETEDFSYLLSYHPDKVVDNVFMFHSQLIKIDVNIQKAKDIWSEALAVLGGPIPARKKDCAYCNYRETKLQPTLMQF